MSKAKLLLEINKLEDINKYPADGYVLGYEKFTFFASKRFNYEEVKAASEKANIYVLLNALLHEDYLRDFKLEAAKLSKLKVSFIVQDMGALSMFLNLISKKVTK